METIASDSESNNYSAQINSDAKIKSDDPGISDTGYCVSDTEDKYYDANDVPSGITVTYKKSGINIPVSEGNLICFDSSSDNGITQMFVDPDSKVWFRIFWENKWTDWTTYPDRDSISAMIKKQLSGNSITTNDVKKALGFVSLGRNDGSTVYKSANSVPANSFLLVASPTLKDLPKSLNSIGSLITFYEDNNGFPKNGTCQFYIDRYGKMASRIKWSGKW